MRNRVFHACFTLLMMSAFLAGHMKAVPLAKSKIVLVLIGAEDFNCHLCLEGLVTFCEKWKQSKSDIYTLGIYSPPKTSTNKGEANRQDVSKKRLEGFIKGYSLMFPVMIDQNRIITNLLKDETDILVIDTLQFTLKSYKYPLHYQAWEEIFSGSENRKEKL